jgi:hypothetical protein
MRDKIKDFLAARGATEGDLGADGQFAETSPSAADFDLLEANLRIPPSSYSLLGLLDEIYQDYAGMVARCLRILIGLSYKPPHRL